MIYASDIEIGRIYRKPVYLPKFVGGNKQELVKGKGSLIYMMTPNFGDALEFLKDERYFKNLNQSYSSYFIDTVYKVKIANSKVYKNKISYKSVVQKAKTTYPKINKVYIKQDQYKGLNLIKDLGVYNSLFRNISKNSKPDEIMEIESKSIVECQYDESIFLGNLNDICGTEKLNEEFKTNVIEGVDPSSYSYTPAKLSSMYLSYMKNNVFNKDSTHYKKISMIVPLEYWMTKEQIPTTMQDFSARKCRNIILFLFDWIENARMNDMPNMDIYFAANGCLVRIDSHNTGDIEKTHSVFLKMVKLKDPLSQSTMSGDIEEVPPGVEQTEEINISTVKSSIGDSIIGLYNSNKKSVGFTGETAEIEVDPETGDENGIVTDDIDADTDGDEAAAKVVSKVDDIVDSIIEDNPNISPEELVEEIDKNEEAIKEISKMKLEMLTGRSNASLKRDAKLREEFLEKKIKNGTTTVRKLLSENVNSPIEITTINRDVLNKDLNSMSVHNMDKTYRETLKEKDLYSIAYAFAEGGGRDLDLIPKNISVEDTSNKFNAKETISIDFEDSARVRHKFVVDVPKLVDDRFIFINGSRKIINKQLMLLPITKTKPDTVMVTTNYNKITVIREGVNVSPSLERIKKLLATCTWPNLHIKIGSNKHLNSEYFRTIEFDELASRFMTIRASNKSTDIYLNFNIGQLYEELSKYNLPCTKSEEFVPIGIKNKKALYISSKTGNVFEFENSKKTDLGYGISELIYIELSGIYGESFDKTFGSINVGKKYIYTKASIMKKKIALGLFLAYCECGITKLLNKLDIPFTISEKSPRYENALDKMRYSVLRFKDCYLQYDSTKYRNVLMMEGLNEAPLRMYDLGDFDTRDAYLEIFESLLGNSNIANAFDNFRFNMIDPITKEVLEELQYPTDFTEVMAFANGLLEDNSHKIESDMSIYRLRSGELINAYVYKTLADAYGTYRITSKNKNPIKVTVPKDKIMKDILTAPNIEEYSVLNPIVELDKTRTVSFKGLSGLNLEQAYTFDKRIYNASMLGILGSSTAYSGAVGITRRLSLDANVKSARGYLNLTTGKDVDKLTAKQLFTAAEALNPLVPNHDDAPRVLMASTQAGHMVPVENTHKILIGNGTDKIIANVMTDDYSFKAKNDGVVSDLDMDLNLMVLKYKDGTNDVVNIGSEMAKNSSSGFYIDNQLIPSFKKGDKIKAGDIVAKNPSYFGDDMVNGQVSYKPGTLAKVAIHSGYFTIEDATCIGESLSEKMATSVVMPKQVVLGPNSNIDFICKVGDMLDVNDPLLIFDESFDSPEINKMLAKMTDEESAEVTDLGKNKIKSKYASSIIDIKIYYTCEFEELSASLKDLIKKYNAKVTKKINFTKKFVKDKFILESKFEPTEKVTVDSRGKVKGVDLENRVMIEFYQKYRDPVGVGDKVIYYTALKGIVSKVIPKDQSAFTKFRPDEPIDAIFGPIGVAARMTTSIETVTLGNKVLVELKRKCKELAYGK